MEWKNHEKGLLDGVIALRERIYDFCEKEDTVGFLWMLSMRVHKGCSGFSVKYIGKKGFWQADGVLQ